MTADEAAFARGVDLFNARSFWHAHEAWESIWLKAEPAVAPFLQGLIQLAAAYHHLQRGTVRGAARLFGSGLRRLEKYPPDFCGLRHQEVLAAASRHQQFALGAAARLESSARSSAERLSDDEFPGMSLAESWREAFQRDVKQRV